MGLTHDDDTTRAWSMKTSESIAELAKALSKAQSAINDPVKGTDNNFLKSKYADLSTVLSVIRPVFGEHGLSIIQLPFGSDGTVGLVTRLMHESGEWIEGGALSISIANAKNQAQAVGMAITYLRRYQAAAYAGVFQADPDANSLADVSPEKLISDSAVDDLDALIKTHSKPEWLIETVLTSYNINSLNDLPESKVSEAFARVTTQCSRESK